MSGLVPYAGYEGPVKREAKVVRRRGPGWTPERLQRADKLMSVGLSARGAGDQLRCSRNAVLGARFRERTRKLEVILAMVSAAYDVTPAAVLSESRERRVSEPRQIAIYLGRTMTGATFERLSRFFDRATGSIADAISVVETRLQGALFRAGLERLRAEIEAASKPSQSPFETTEMETRP